MPLKVRVIFNISWRVRLRSTNEPSLLSAIDVLLVNCCVLYTSGGEGFTLIFTLDRYGPLDRVWFLGGSTLKWGIIFALVGAVLLV